MAKFKVDTAKTAEYVEKLKVLKDENNEVTKRPDTQASCGKTYEELQNLCDQVAEVRAAFGILLDKTTEFLEVADDTFNTSDQLAASSVSKKGS